MWCCNGDYWCTWYVVKDGVYEKKYYKDIIHNLYNDDVVWMLKIRPRTK